jgi:hypothetical protein
MDTEFHYWITGLIAHRAGFSKDQANVVAHACELVDHNDVALEIRDPAGGHAFVNTVSQTLNILRPRHELMRIYPIFHFVPGEPMHPAAWRRDGAMHILNTTPGGPAVQDLLSDALKAPEETRLYRIGIASHAFQDSWAHQNFAGWYHPFNHLGLDPKPNIGHADAEHHPDWMSHLWHDDRLIEPEISNRARYLEAAQSLFARLSEALRPASTRRDLDAAWRPLEQELLRLMGPTWSGRELRYREQRMRRYRDKLPWMAAFDQRSWFDEAVETSVRGLEDSHEGWPRRLTVFEDRYTWREDVDPEQTHWLRFQQAVRDHERAGIARLQPTFARMGIDLARA